MADTLTKSRASREASGYYSAGYKQRIPQEIALTANVANKFTAVKYEIVELTATVAGYYRITQAGTDATADGNVCFYLHATERRELVCSVGDVISFISATNGKAFLVEKG